MNDNIYQLFEGLSREQAKVFRDLLFPAAQKLREAVVTYIPEKPKAKLLPKKTGDKNVQPTQNRK